MRVYIFGLCLTLLVPSTRDAFGQPGTEIYLFDMKVKKGTVFITNPRNITHRPGYDNQPFFHPDEPLIYYAAADTSGRTDIMVYDYRRRRHQIAYTYGRARVFADSNARQTVCIVHRTAR